MWQKHIPSLAQHIITEIVKVTVGLRSNSKVGRVSMVGTSGRWGLESPG
jgi:hypothetical protein